MAPNKPKVKRSDVAGDVVDSPAALFLKSQGIVLPAGVTGIKFVDSGRLQVCAARVQSTVKELKANGLLSRFVTNRRQWNHLKASAGGFMHDRQQQHVGFASEEQARFVAKMIKKDAMVAARLDTPFSPEYDTVMADVASLADKLTGSSLTATTFWDPSIATTFYVECDENSQFSSGMCRALPIGDYKLVDWEADDDPLIESERVRQLEADIIAKHELNEALFRMQHLRKVIGLMKEKPPPDLFAGYKNAAWTAELKRYEALYDTIANSEEAQRFDAYRILVEHLESMNLPSSAEEHHQRQVELAEAIRLRDWFNPGFGVQLETDLPPPSAAQMREHMDNPPCFSMRSVDEMEASEYTKAQFEKIDLKFDSKSEKLVMDFTELKRSVRWSISSVCS